MSTDYSPLKTALRGELIQPADAGYDEARRLYNAMIDKKPAAIARCVDAADVMTCVNYARDNKILLAIRGGGHNGPGLGSCNDGLVIDLSAMKGIRVDPAAATAQVGGGCVWGDVDHATHAFGLAAASGIISTTGVGGLTLGGGLGHLSRKCGLTIDNLLEVDMVLADGSFVTANATKNTDLFWAVRGGGGNFGVATSFTFRLHPISTVCAGPMFWAIEDAPAILKAYEPFITNAAEELNGFFAFMTVPPAPMFPAELHLRKVCAVFWCSTASPERTAEMLKPTESWGKSLLSGVGPMPFPVLQSLFDGLYSPGLQWYWKADFVDTLSDAAIAEHVKHGSQLPSMHATMHLYPITGAAPCWRDGYRLGIPQDEVGRSHRGSRSRSCEQGKDHGLGEELLGSRSSIFSRWSLRQHDDGRRRCPGGGVLQRKFRTFGPDQGEVRSRQSVPGESKHRA